MKIKRLICTVIFLAAWIGPVLFAAMAQESLERMDARGFDTFRRPAAVFSHDDHNETAELEDDCAVCHHVYENGVPAADESSEDSSCSDCHGIKSESENSVSLEAAYHRRCKSCHFDTGRGPVLCGECHRKYVKEAS